MEKEILIQELGKKVRSIRREKNMTQQELGDFSHLSYKYVGEIERAEKNPSIDVLNRIANALQIDLLELIELGSPALSKKDEAKKNIISRITRQLMNLNPEELEKINKIVRVIFGK